MPSASHPQLAAFLRARREALDPANFDFPDLRRRRTPGLRREEVAQLAAISVTYYTYLEQGREVRPSPEVLTSLAAALRLDPAESAHLFALGGGTPSATAPEGSLHPLVAELVDRVDPWPAYVTSPTFDVLASNAAARDLWTDWPALPESERNMVWWTFTSTAARERFVDWETEARMLLGRFRATAARHPDDRAFAELSERILSVSNEARGWWADHDVAPISSGTKRMRHPQRGIVELEHTVLLAADVADTKLVVFRPREQGERLSADD